MTALIIVLVIAGIIAGLVQFFADYKGLPLYQPSKDVQGFDGEQTKDWLNRWYDFVRKHWQFFGYQIIGIAGALLVPVIAEYATLKGVEEYKKCFCNPNGNDCADFNWYLLVVLGYGIILGYSSVRLIRSLGSFLLGNVTKLQVDQQQDLSDAKKRITDLEAKLATLTPFDHHFMDFTGSPQLSKITPNSADDEFANTEIKDTIGFGGCDENSAPRPWKDWRPAISLTTLLGRVNQLAPGRKKSSDGMIGDIDHQSRDSDHNPWVWDTIAGKGVVTALDITHDPAGGCDCNIFAGSLEANKDPRVKYVIWNRRIMNASPINGTNAWIWRPYNGSNPHDKHIHISVSCNNILFDDKSDWKLKIS